MLSLNPIINGVENRTLTIVYGLMMIDALHFNPQFAQFGSKPFFFPTFGISPLTLHFRSLVAGFCHLVQFGSVSVIPIQISHPNSGSGYKFIENDKQFVFLNDNELEYVHINGLPFEAYRDFCEGIDLLIHDAEYTPEEYRTTIEWGHSVYTDVLKLAVQAGFKQLGLFHTNQERTDLQMDILVADATEDSENKAVPSTALQLPKI